MPKKIPNILGDDRFLAKTNRNRTIPKPVDRKRSVLLPADIHARLKLIAAQEDIFIQDVVRNALDDYEKKLAKRDARLAAEEEAKWNERP